MSSNLPALNAALNATAAVLLFAGLRAIRGGKRGLHERLMLSAFAVSCAFLACYLYYHFAVAKGQPTRFHGTGLARIGYFALLGSHTVLAVVNLPMVLRTLYLAKRERWADHKRAARRTFPVWMYVSVTGVLVYLVLYHFNPPPAVP